MGAKIFTIGHTVKRPADDWLVELSHRSGDSGYSRVVDSGIGLCSSNELSARSLAYFDPPINVGSGGSTTNG